jgi:predicted cupin superfamily sugar epimerase
METAEEIIEFFRMKPLPREGGYYVETYRCDEKIAGANLPKRYTGQRSFSSTILYLLTPDTFSRLHKLASDEMFHFYLGDTVTMLQLHPDGSSEMIELGPDLAKGRRVQVTVPRGAWQGCYLNQGGKFALMGTTVSPGFEFADFEEADRDRLLNEYPTREKLILRLTRPTG